MDKQGTIEYLKNAIRLETNLFTEKEIKKRCLEKLNSIRPVYSEIPLPEKPLADDFFS